MREGGREKSREAARSSQKDVIMRDQSGSKAKADSAKTAVLVLVLEQSARCKAPGGWKQFSAGFCLVQPPFFGSLCLLVQLRALEKGLELPAAALDKGW